MSVIIIESPNKIKKIQEITGDKVFATVGHFMELSPVKKNGENLGSMCLNFDADYEPNFGIVAEKQNSIYKIIEECKKEVVYIASDPDREGYAIGYMFYELIKNVAKEVYRTEFHEITENGVKKGLKDSVLFAQTNMNYYDSFLGRRCGDRLIGFTISPIIAKSLNIKTLSAGRVQTPALSLITNREKEIKEFENLDEKDKVEFQVILKVLFDNKEEVAKEIINGKEIKYKTKDEALKAIESIKDNKSCFISSDEKTIIKKSPPKPFTTSKLLKIASKALKIPTNDIQSKAQKLFEAGLITYIRTDSEFLSKDFLNEGKSFLESTYKDYEYREYTAGKNSQAEAHEAIRITHFHKYEDINSICQKEKLDDICEKLYTLIYKNSVQSQMCNAEYENISLIFKVKLKEFRLNIKTLSKSGFLGIFNENIDEEEELRIGKLNYKIDEQINIQELAIKDIKKSSPKPYMEADFIEVLEKTGIGRPSTYSSYLPTLLSREYITISNDTKREINPTKLGMSVIDFLAKSKNAWLLDLKFTADMESKLDDICEKKSSYKDFMFELHKKMDFVKPQVSLSGNGITAPSEKQLNFCKKIAEILKIKLPRDIETNWKIAKEFIDKHKETMDKVMQKKAK